MPIYTYFLVNEKVVDLELSSALYDRVSKLASYLRIPRTNILSMACSHYGVSVDAVEKYLDNDMKEEMVIAENCEL